MRKIILFMLVAISSQYAFGEDLDKVAQAIVKEGKELYHLEMASWHGTDVFLENYSKRENIGGYFSYLEKENIKCIFFSKEDNPVVIGTVVFDSTFQINKAVITTGDRKFTDTESDLYTIRKNAITEVQADNMFKSYDKTRFNLIPIIHNGAKKVYVLTGPNVTGLVIFGNDYLLTFDANNKLTSKKQLHKNIITLDFDGKAEETTMTMHSHHSDTGCFMTPTDVCTLMLYQEKARWAKHFVMSDKYVNIWDCNKNELLIIDKKTWDKMRQDTQENK